MTRDKYQYKTNGIIIYQYQRITNKKRLGYISIAVGIITYPIPLTTPLLIGYGFKLLGYTKDSIYKLLRAMGIRQKARLGISKTHLYKDIRSYQLG